MDTTTDASDVETRPAGQAGASRPLRWPYVASFALLVAMAVATAFVAPTLPAMMPVHWDITLTPDRWEPAAPWGAFVPAIFGMAFVALMALAERLDPRVRREPALRWLPAGSAIAVAVLCTVFTVLVWVQAGAADVG
jgi:hypothetical protein